MFFPKTCAVCGQTGHALCGRCARRLVPVTDPDPIPGLDSFAALYEWDAVSRTVITALKYRNAKAVVPWLAAGLAAKAPERPGRVTWIPTTPDRRRERGFDQAELLARSVARRLGVPAVRFLARDRGPAQTGSSAEMRHRGPRLRVRRPLRGSVLVVDDVCTTGASLSRAAQALDAAGADAVHGLAVARVL